MIKIIDKQDFNELISTYKPLGVFLLLEKDGSYTGIDNTTGDAWTENFTKLSNCFKYLRGYSLDELEV